MIAEYEAQEQLSPAQAKLVRTLIAEAARDLARGLIELAEERPEAGAIDLLREWLNRARGGEG